MAQPTQWVPAILDYTRKAKSNISTSHPIPTHYVKSINEAILYEWISAMSIVLTIKKTELEVGKRGYYRQGGARSIKKGVHLC